MAILQCTIGSPSRYEVYIEYSYTQNASTQKSTIYHALKVKQLTNYEFAGNMNVTYYIAGTAFSYNATVDINDDVGAGQIVTVKSGTTTITHDSTTGDASFKVSCSGNCYSGGYGPGSIELAETTVTLDRLPIYDLSISAGTGSTITVNRTSSGGKGATGNLTAGTNKLYYGDKLKISFTPSNNYAISTHTVNNSTFTSGNTHTVSKDVSVISTAQVLSSSISASDADIEAVSTIKITRYNNSYYHSIKYQYGSLSGYINRDGTTSLDEVRFTDDTINFTLPSSFYGETPRSPIGFCKLTCYTYEKENSSQILGSVTECTFTATVSRAKSSPVISKYSITSDNTTYLTGDNTILVRHLSDVNVFVEAEPKNSAFISKITINNDVFNMVGTANTAETTYENITDNNFVITAVDTRNYSVEITPPVTIVPYLPLTLNALINRKPPSGDGSTSEIVATFNGNYYNGSFGSIDNMLQVEFCYKERNSENAVYSDWLPISSDNYIIGSDRYYTTSEVSLGKEYNYQKIYDFIIRVSDATGEIGWATQNIPTLPAIPVFDWGENDFNFNVPVSYINQRMFYLPGDQVTLAYPDVYFCGCLTDGNYNILFTIPLTKPIFANGVKLTGAVVPRGIGSTGYMLGAGWNDAETRLDLEGVDGHHTVTTYINDSGITVKIVMSSKITSTPNNTPICVSPWESTPITITFI